jgi:hypothetical protein
MKVSDWVEALPQKLQTALLFVVFEFLAMFAFHNCLLLQTIRLCILMQSARAGKLFAKKGYRVKYFANNPSFSAQGAGISL